MERGLPRPKNGLLCKGKMKKTYVIILISAIVLLLSNASLLFGLFQAKEGLVFLGRRDINSQDVYTYVSFIEQSKQGKFLFENLYAVEAQKGDLFRPSYMIIGKLAWLLNISSLTAYHTARIGIGILFFLVLYKFLGLFFKDSRSRVLAHTIVLTSSGIGFIVRLVAANSIDTWIPEANTFLSLAEAPHFLLSQIYMLGGFMAFLKGIMQGKKRYLAASSLCFLLLSFEHPFNIAVTLATVLSTAFWLIKTGTVKFKSSYIGLLAIVIVSVFGLGFQVFETYQNPILNSWASQNALLSPPAVNYLAGYGFLLVLGAIGLEKFLKEKKPQQVLVIAWIGAVSVLLYAPIFFQRRFSEGLHIPLAILAAWGILKLTRFISNFSIERAQKYVINFFWAATVIILTLTSFVRVLTDVSIFAGESKEGYYYYILSSEMEGLEWLKAHSNSSDIILTNWFYGNIVPGIAGRKVYLGHKVQTPFFDKKVEDENKFFLNKNTTEAYNFLKENRITHIFLGANDTILQYGFKPDEKPYLVKVFDQDGTLIYKVK